MSDALWPVLSDPTVRNVRPASYGVCMTVIDTEDLDEESASGHVHGICLKTGPPRRVGVELEGLGAGGRGPAPPPGVGAGLVAPRRPPSPRGRPGRQSKPGGGRRRGGPTAPEGITTGHVLVGT